MCVCAYARVHTCSYLYASDRARGVASYSVKYESVCACVCARARAGSSVSAPESMCEQASEPMRKVGYVCEEV
jgi:hypothetical protein